jgi:hypothetical protein
MNYPLALAAAGTLVMGLCMAVLLVIECLRALRHGETPREPA